MTRYREDVYPYVKTIIRVVMGDDMIIPNKIVRSEDLCVRKITPIHTIKPKNYQYDD